MIRHQCWYRAHAAAYISVLQKLVMPSPVTGVGCGLRNIVLLNSKKEKK